MSDPWQNASGGIESSIEGVGAVTYDADIAVLPRALYIGAAGNVAVVFQDTSEATLTALAVGVWHPIRVRKVKGAGGGTTVAANLILLGY